MKNKRTLYECSHARVTGERIRCRRGHPFSLKSEDGGIEVKRLARGEPLALDICQACGDFDGTWEPMPESDRGWSTRHEVTKHNKSVKKGGAVNERW